MRYMQAKNRNVTAPDSKIGLAVAVIVARCRSPHEVRALMSPFSNSTDERIQAVVDRAVSDSIAGALTACGLLHSG
jgi:hypothetical protein